MDDEDSFGDELIMESASDALEGGDNKFVQTSTNRYKGDHDKTIIGMLDLMTEEKGKDTNEVNENAITQQKQKAEQMINELQLKMKQIVLDSDPRNDEELPAEDLDQAENSQKSDAIIGALRQIQHDITGQYDFSLGNIDHGLANLFCQENLHIVTMPKNYLPKRAKTGDIITISVARKKAEIGRAHV